MRKFLISCLLLFGLSGVTNAHVISSYVTGTTGYQQLYNSTTMTAGAWMNLTGSIPNSLVYDVSELPTGDIIVAHRTGTTDYVQIFDGTTLADGARIALPGVKSVSGLENGGIVAAYTSGSSDYLQVFEPNLAEGAWIVFDTVIDVTGLAGGDICVAYNTGGSTDYVEIYDVTLTSALGWMGQKGIEYVTGMANGDVAVYYGASTNYLQMFSGDGAWTGGVWIAQQDIIDIGGTTDGSIVVAYTTGSTEYMQIYDGATLAADGAWVAIDTILNVDGDYLSGLIAECSDENHPYPAGDLSKDCKTDIDDLSILVQQWLGCTDPTGSCLDLRDNWNFSAPEIASITVDGDLSDWAESSGFVTFNVWLTDPNDEGLASTSKAQYAWNDTANKLYIGIETTQGSSDWVVEVGGLMGNITPYVSPAGGRTATQLKFEYVTVPGSLRITNQTNPPGITNGVVAHAALDGSTLTLEIETPVYSDWKDDPNGMDLSAGMDIYAYANVFDFAQSAADSQISYGTYQNWFTSWVTENASKILLIQGMTDCGTQGYLDEDLNLDCIVNLKEYAVIAKNWMVCSHPDCD